MTRNSFWFLTQKIIDNINIMHRQINDDVGFWLYRWESTNAFTHHRSNITNGIIINHLLQFLDNRIKPLNMTNRKGNVILLSTSNQLVSFAAGSTS